MPCVCVAAGVGITRDGLATLFREYVQGTEDEMCKPRTRGGTGLGLSICSKQVRDQQQAQRGLAGCGVFKLSAGPAVRQGGVHHALEVRVAEASCQHSRGLGTSRRADIALAGSCDGYRTQTCSCSAASYRSITA